jgi:hypothetical protein
MSEDKRYDASLQMFVEDPREPNMTRLRFLRWLGEQQRLEHEVFGPPSGEFVTLPAAIAAETLPLAS